MRKSVASRILHLVIAIGFTVGVALLAFVWSLNNTISFTRSVMVEDPWGTIMGLVIQFGPQVFLALAATATGSERTGWFGAFFLFSGVDAATNIGATLNLLEAGVVMNPLQLVVRIFLDIIIVFGEEMVGFGISVVFHDMAELIVLFGEVPPQWMFIAEDISSRLGTGYTAAQRRKKQQKPRGRQKPHGQPRRQNRHQPQPVATAAHMQVPPQPVHGPGPPPGPPDTVAAARKAQGRSGLGG